MADIDRLTKRAGLQEAYRFFGLDVTIRSDDRQVLADFRKIYRRFAVPGPPGAGLTFTILTPAEGMPHFCLIAGRQIYTLDSLELLPNIYFFLLNFITGAVRDYFLIHAGVVAMRGRAIVVSAPSMVGKTTLILSLLLRGLEFLSDELAPIQKDTHLIEPFPRSLGLRARTVDLFPALREKCGGLSTIESGGERKVMVDVEREGLAPLGKPCAPALVIFLTPQMEREGEEPARFLELCLNMLPDSVLRKMKRIPGVIDAVRLPERPIPTCRLILEKDARIVKELDALCLRESLFISRSLPGATAAPDYNRPPVLRPLSKADGALGLARNLQSGAQSALFEAHGGSIPRLVFALAGLAENVDFFTLQVGRLQEMTELIVKLASTRL
jgi:hypothetical protein